MSYWNKTGKYQKEYEELFDKLVPADGMADTYAGELLRAASKLYYRYFNDGDEASCCMPLSMKDSSVASAYAFLAEKYDMSVLEGDYETGLENLVDEIIEDILNGNYQEENTTDYLDTDVEEVIEFYDDDECYYDEEEDDGDWY